MADSPDRRRVLVVDDDPSSAGALRVTLEDASFDVRCAGSSVEANAHVVRWAAELVVADIVMQGNEQLEWVQYLARAHPRLPVILVTGRPELETAIRAVGLTVRAYLVKPVTAERLVAEVSRAIVPPTEEALESKLPRIAALWGLTDQQSAVLKHVATGAANKEIARALDCKIRTIEDHVGRIMRRANVASRARLLARFWGG